jgi:restriction endonuclease S subunit
MKELASGGTFKEISKSNLSTIQIPLPPLKVQEEIVAEIEGYQKIIDGAKQVIENFKPRIEINPEWEMDSIEEISTLITKGSSPNWQGIEYTNSSKGILFITSENIQSGFISFKRKKYVEKRFNLIEKKSILKNGDILTNIVGASIGRTAMFDLNEIANINQAVCLVRLNLNKVDTKYILYLFNTDWFVNKLLGNRVENARANVNMGSIKKMKIPLPSLEIQEKIASQFEKEQELVNANKQLIEIFDQMVKTFISRILKSMIRQNI